jgi:hypothetical protein
VLFPRNILRVRVIVRAAFVTLAGASLASLLACEPGLRVREIDAAQEKPANVMVFFRVNAGPTPVSGLEESSFTLKEDEHVIGPGVDRVIVNPDLRSEQATLVLLDLGGRPSPDELDAMATGVSALLDKMAGQGARKVGLYALDGASQPFPLAPFGSSLDAAKAAAARIPSYKTRDPSLDLNGGYIAALHLLKQATPTSSGPRIVNLVLVVRGPDRASRADAKAVALELKKSDLDVSRYAVAFGVEATQETIAPKLRVFADGPLALAASGDSLRGELQTIADEIDVRGRSYYLLSYCTAARGGPHRVELAVERQQTNAKGHPELLKGSLDYSFRADGFGPGCTPDVPDGWRTDDHNRVSLVATQGAKVDRPDHGKPAKAQSPAPIPPR